MQNPTSIVLSRIVAQTRAMDVTATNIANSSTPGYRTERVVFSDFLVPEKRGITGAETSLTYVADRSTFRDTQAGALTPTGDPLDLAITGAGFFSVLTPGGAKLTRAGHFGLSATGTVVDDNGNALLDSTGKPLQTSPSDTAVTVASDGSMSTRNGQIGRIGVVVAADLNKLKGVGSRLYDASATATTADPKPKIVQGAIEGSNVAPTLELTNMMNMSREFQFASQFLQSESEREQGVIDKILQTHS